MIYDIAECFSDRVDELPCVDFTRLNGSAGSADAETPTA